MNNTTKAIDRHCKSHDINEDEEIIMPKTTVSIVKNPDKHLLS